MDTGIYKNLIP